MAEWLTPRTLDQEVRVSSLARRVFPIDKELYSTLCLFTQVYKWVSATYCGGLGGGGNFVSPSGHVMFHLLYKPPMNYQIISL